MKSIYDVFRLFLDLQRENYSSIRIETNNFYLYFDTEYDNGILIHDEKSFFTFIFYLGRISNGCLEVDKPSSDGRSLKVLWIDISFLDDMFTMDDNQLILTYGKFYPEYLSGDLSELYDSLLKYR